MSAPESTPVLTCSLCGQPCLEVDGGRGWLHLEVTREERVGGEHWWEVDFCSQEHAAEWFARPLPPPAGAVEPPAGTVGDRLATLGCFAVFALVVVVLAVGTWNVASFVLSLF